MTTLAALGWVFSVRMGLVYVSFSRHMARRVAGLSEYIEFLFQNRVVYEDHRNKYITMLQQVTSSTPKITLRELAMQAKPAIDEMAGKLHQQACVTHALGRGKVEKWARTGSAADAVREHLSEQAKYDPSTDSNSLALCVDRLRVVVEELGKIGEFLQQGETAPAGESTDPVRAAIDHFRVPGFCGYKLAVEAWTILELVAVRLASIRRTGVPQHLADKIDAIERYTDGLDPLVRGALTVMAPFKSLDPSELLRAVAERIRKEQ